MVTSPCARLVLAAALAAAGPAGAQRPEAPRTEAPRTIAGRVLGPDGEPATAVDVYLRWRAHPELPGSFGHSLAPAGTDPSDVEPGMGELVLHTDDRGMFRCEPPHRGPFLLVARDAAAGLGSARTFPVMHGSFQTLRLEPGFTMSGRVLDASGEPVASAEVRLAPTVLQWQRVGIYNLPARRATATSDAAGRYRLRYELGYLRAPRWTVLTAPLAVAGDRSSAALLDPLRPVQSARDHDLVLADGPAAAGRVVDEKGAPIVGAQVFCASLPGATATTDAQGRYLLPACRGDLTIRAPGRDTALGQPLATGEVALTRGVEVQARLRGPQGPLASARVLWAQPLDSGVPIEWTATTDAQGRVTATGIAHAVPLFGFVELDGRFRLFHADTPIAAVDLGELMVGGGEVVQGQVLGRDRQPLPYVRVALWPMRRAVRVPPYITYTDHGGRFAFAPVTGDHALAVDAGMQGTVAMAVPAGSLGEEQTLVLGEGGSLAGIVLDEAGRPAAGAWLTVSRTVSEPGTYVPAPRDTMQALCGLAGPDGRFAFAGLPSGVTWTVTAALLRDDVKYRATASVQVGGTAEVRPVLKLAVEQR